MPPVSGRRVDSQALLASTPPYDHCNFTVREDLPERAFRGSALSAHSGGKPPS